jgi:hypothetical protein
MTIIKPIILAALMLTTLNRAGAVTRITSLPYTITKSGNYELTGNLTANGTDGIDVNVSNVVINLNGFSITQSSAGSGSGIKDVSFSNVVVSNGTISGFAAGVILGDETAVSNCEVQNVRVLGAIFGVLLYGSDALVKNCSIVGTGASNSSGISIVGVNGEVRNCNITLATTGIYSTAGLDARSGSAFLHNCIASCPNGLVLDPSDYYQGNVVTNCTSAFSSGNAVGTENGGY